MNNKKKLFLGMHDTDTDANYEFQAVIKKNQSIPPLIKLLKSSILLLKCIFTKLIYV